MSTTVKKPPIWALITGVVVLLILASAIIYQTIANRAPDFNYDKPGTDFTLQNIDGKNVTFKDTSGQLA